MGAEYIRTIIRNLREHRTSQSTGLVDCCNIAITLIDLVGEFEVECEAVSVARNDRFLARSGGSFRWRVFSALRSGLRRPFVATGLA